jgi:hypothetical protein
MAEDSMPVLPPIPDPWPTEPGHEANLATMLGWLKSSPAFARHVRRQLYQALSGDTTAQDSLKFLFLPKGDEVIDLGYSLPNEMEKLGSCTEHARLTAMLVDGYM